MRTARALATLVVALLLSASRTQAQSATAGTPVAETHLAAETNASVIPDGASGAYVGFKIAYRSASLPAEVAVARITASAGRDPGWSALPMIPAGSLPQYAPPGASRVVRGPAGNVLAFADYSNTAAPNDVVREFAAAGATPGYPGFQSSYSYNIFSAVSRSDGGTLILSKALGSINLLATVVTPAGAGTEVFTPLELSNGITAAVGGEALVAVPSGVDGGIAVFLLPFVAGSTGVDIVAVRVDATGHPVWLPPSRNVVTAPFDQRDQNAVSDGADGAVIVWDDDRTLSSAPDIFAQRLLANGTVAPGWAAGGKSICVRAGNQIQPAIAGDDAGGAWFAWMDDRSVDTSGVDLYFTHVLANGTIATGFAANGSALCKVAGDQTTVRLVRDGLGGVFAVWLDGRNGGVDLYAQHLNSSGHPTTGWAATGNAVCTNSAPKAQPAIALAYNGRAIVAWNDARTGTDIVYAAAIDAARGVLDVPRAAGPALALAPATNPSRGGITLRVDAEGPGEVRVTLFDVAGRIQAERIVSGPARAAGLRFDGLRPGLYLARASRAGTSTTTRIAVLE